MKMIKSSLEREDVSDFRRYVRKTRFDTPTWHRCLDELAARLDKGEKPAIALIRTGATLSSTDNVLDSIGAGKTDFVYFAASYYRDRGYAVLAFPDLRDRLTPTTNFYRDIFVPEIIRLTDNALSQLTRRTGIFVREWIKSLANRLLLLIRTSAVLVVALIAFFLTGGFGAITYILDKKPEILQIILAGIPLGAFFIGLIIFGFFYVWDKIRNDDRKLAEWNSYAPNFGIEHGLTENINQFSPSSLFQRITRIGKRIFVIVDDVEGFDSASVNFLLELEELSKDAQQRLAIVFLFESALNRPIVEDRALPSVLTEFEARRRGWQYLSLEIPSEAEVRLLLWGYYKSPMCDEIANIIYAESPETQINTGFLLQFLYDVAAILENEDRNLESLLPAEINEWYSQFLDRWRNRADYILRSIGSESFYEPSKEMLKFIMAFQDLRAEKYVVDLLMKEAGHTDPEHIAKFLVERGLLAIAGGEERGQGQTRYYAFASPSIRSNLALAWPEWRASSRKYKTKVFWTLYEHARTRIKTHPYLAKDCDPSRLVVDVLWREGDANWLYGGRADAKLALAYYGLDDGALGKWLTIFQRERDGEQVSTATFYWRSEAPNSPFRFVKSSKSPVAYSFIGDLVRRTVGLYALAGERKLVKHIHDELWPEIVASSLASPLVDEKVKRDIEVADQQIKLRHAFHLYSICSSPDDWQRARSICEMLIAQTQDSVIRLESERLSGRMEYFSHFGLGNCLHPVTLIKNPRIESHNLDPRLLEVSKVTDDLDMLELHLTHVLDYLTWAETEDGDKSNIDFALTQTKDIINKWKLSITSVMHPGKLVEQTEGPELGAVLLISQGAYSWLCGIAVKQITEWFQQRAPSKRQDIGLRIRKFYEFCQEIRDFRETNALANMKVSSDIDTTGQEAEHQYSKYVVSKSNKEAVEWLEKIEETSSSLAVQIEGAFYRDSLYFLHLASQLASFRGLRELERSVEYYRLISTTAIAHTDREHVASTWQIDTVYQLEKELPVAVGRVMEGAKSHVLAAQSSYHPRFEAYEYERASSLISSLAGLVPSVISGELISKRLTALGNFGDVSHPDEILALAQQAHEIFKDATEENITKAELDERKAHVRWWIAEAYARLASESPSKVIEYLEAARPHLNWIERHSRDNPDIMVYDPKTKQVRAHFLEIQGNLESAAEELLSALRYYREENLPASQEFYESIQTLEMLVSVERDRLSKKHQQSGKGSPEDYDNLFVWLDEL